MYYPIELCFHVIVYYPIECHKHVLLSNSQIFRSNTADFQMFITTFDMFKPHSYCSSYCSSYFQVYRSTSTLLFK
ncbi:hypothetical protein Hdeb2414_s0002g00066281 [Helianthus debilis subsp. tardiflorus]